MNENSPDLFEYQHQKLDQQSFSNRALNAVGNLFNEKSPLVISLEKKIAWDRANHIIKGSGITQDLIPDNKYLDVGSGPGHIAQLLRRQKFNIIGSDPFIKPFASIRQEQQKNDGSHTIFASAQHLPFSEEVFDGIMMNFVAHHTSPEDWSLIFDEIERVCKSEGSFILLEDVPLESGDRSTSVWDNWTNGEIKELIKNLFRRSPHHNEKANNHDEPIMKQLKSGKVSDLHLTDLQWHEIFQDRNWTLLDEKEFFSHDPVTNKDIRHKKFKLKLPAKQ